jgi:uncharacterized protein (DUF302 family)
MSFYLNRNVNESFDAVLKKLKERLHAQDYLIAADIDVQGALKQKLDADLPRIRIIGTNTPKVGYQLFTSDPKLGTLLPFSIVLHELGKNKTEVTMIDPEWLFRSVDNPEITHLASSIKSIFIKTLAQL